MWHLGQAKEWLGAGLLLAALGLAGCAQAAESADGSASESAAEVEPVPGTELAKVTLADKAARRIGIQTATVREATAVTPATAPTGSGGAAKPGTRPGARPAAKPAGKRLAVPYSALLYDEKGATWVFTATAPLTFLRHEVTVDRVEGDTATLTAGPPAGTTVVTVGAPELLGAELGVGE